VTRGFVYRVRMGIYYVIVLDGFESAQRNGRFDVPVTTDAFVYYHTRRYLFATMRVGLPRRDRSGRGLGDVVG